MATPYIILMCKNRQDAMDSNVKFGLLSLLCDLLSLFFCSDCISFSQLKYRIFISQFAGRSYKIEQVVGSYPPSIYN